MIPSNLALNQRNNQRARGRRGGRVIIIIRGNAVAREKQSRGERNHRTVERYRNRRKKRRKPDERKIVSKRRDFVRKLRRSRLQRGVSPRERGLCASVQRNENGFCSFFEEEEEKEEEKMPSLPFGIDFEEDTAKDVVGKLGEPTSKGGTGVQIFIVYEMLGIKISFNALDWENAGASIHSMAVWKASD